MSPQFIPADTVRDVIDRIERARQLSSTRHPEPPGHPDDPHYWQDLFEAHAAAVLNALSRVQLANEHAVRYRFYGRYGHDLLVRPFVARSATDVSAIRRLIDWHPSPDSAASSPWPEKTRDVEFLYRHFVFEPSPAGYFEYWIAMQELWASARWIHSRVIADGEHFSTVVADSEWQIQRHVEHFEPAVVTEKDGAAQLAVLIHCLLDRHTVALHTIQISAEQAIVFGEVLPVAQGPRGYVT